MVIEDLTRHFGQLLALICEGFMDASFETFQQASLDVFFFDLFLFRDSISPFFFVFFLTGVIFLFCLYLQGWPMNRQF